MSRRELPSWTLPVSWACLVAWAVVMALALAGCHGTVIVEPDANGWPESAEFSELESGQARFSSHSCGDRGGAVIVDHLTGVQYLMSTGGICPLLDADGTPLLVAEAGE